MLILMPMLFTVFVPVTSADADDNSKSLVYHLYYKLHHYFHYCLHYQNHHIHYRRLYRYHVYWCFILCLRWLSWLCWKRSLGKDWFSLAVFEGVGSLQKKWDWLMHSLLKNEPLWKWWQAPQFKVIAHVTTRVRDWDYDWNHKHIPGTQDTQTLKRVSSLLEYS
jgi:hypothetical protein